MRVVASTPGHLAIEACAKNRGLRRTPRVLPGQFRMISRSKGIE